MSEPRSWLRNRRAAVLVLLAFATALRCYRLGTQNLWLDEVVHVRIASQSPAEILRHYHPRADLTRRDQAPLSFLVLHPFLSPAHLEWRARLPSALFGAAEVVAIYFVGCELLLPFPVPLVAALLLATSPIHVWYSQEARWYAQWAWLTTLSYLALLRAWRSNTAAAWASYGVLTICAVYTFIFAFFVIACQTVSAWWLSRARNGSPRFWRTFVGVQIAVVVAAGTVLWVVLNQLGLSTGTPRATTVSALPYTMFAFLVGFTLGPTLAYLHRLPELLPLALEYPVIVVVLAVEMPLIAWGVRGLARQRAAAAVILPWCLGLPLLVFSLSRLTLVTYQVRYSFAALPAFMLLLAIGIHETRGRWWRRAWAVTLSACVAASLANHYWNPAYQKEDVRAALAHVRAAAIAGARVVPVGQIDIAAEFYGRDLTVVRRADCGGSGRPVAIDQELGQVAWVVIGRDWMGEGSRCLERLAASYAPVEHLSFPGVELWRLTRRDEVN